MKTSSRKIMLTIVLLGLESIAFGMMVVYQKPIVEIIKEKEKTNNDNVKLLEHKIFKGKSLWFQNQFFLSNYKEIPRVQKDIIQKILNVSDVDYQSDISLDAILLYHQEHRSECYKILIDVKQYIDLIKKSYIEEVKRLRVENKVPKYPLRDIVNPFIRIFNGMSHEWKVNNYPAIRDMAETKFEPLAGKDHRIFPSST